MYRQLKKKKSILRENEPGKRRRVWESGAIEVDSGRRKYLKEE